MILIRAILKKRFGDAIHTSIKTTRLPKMIPMVTRMARMMRRMMMITRPASPPPPPPPSQLQSPSQDPHETVLTQVLHVHVP